MDSLRMDTTQNVSLRYNAAGVGLRILAGLLDTLFVYAYAVIVISLFSLAMTKRSASVANQDEAGQIMIGLLILCLLPAFLYHLLCETFLDGQSFGKKIIRIKVVKLDGTQPGFGSFLIRSMFRIIDISFISPVVAVLTIALSSRSQRFGDMVAGTTVIQVNRPVSIRETILHLQKPDHKTVYSQVALLSDADANIIREVLDFSLREGQPQHLQMLSEKIQHKYGIGDVRQPPADFLNTLLMDYTNYRFER